MKKFFTLITLVAVSGCAGMQHNTQNKGFADTTAVPSSSFSHFTDIPVPPNAIMNLDKTVILGSGEQWTGKLAFSAKQGPNTTFDYFIEELPKFGWKETAIVRADVSFMTYNRSGRELIIQIYGDGGESTVDMMVSPEHRAKQ